MEWGGGGCDKKSQGEGKKVRGETQRGGLATRTVGVRTMSAFVRAERLDVGGGCGANGGGEAVRGSE